MSHITVPNTRKLSFAGAIACALLSFIISLAGLLSSASAGFLDYRWSKRPLVIFAPTPDGAALAAQRRIIRADRVGILDRDMVIITVVGDRVSTLMGSGRPGTAVGLRRRFGVAKHEFRVVLVGKDGSVKRHTDQPVSAAALFQQIDAMPMRRQEMRRRRD